MRTLKQAKVGALAPEVCREYSIGTATFYNVKAIHCPHSNLKLEFDAVLSILFGSGPS